MIQKPHTYFADLRSLPKALQHLTSLKRWVVWRWIARTQNGETKWTKPPYQCRHPRTSAKSNDPTTWGTYQEAVAAVAAGEALINVSDVNVPVNVAAAVNVLGAPTGALATQPGTIKPGG